MSHNVLTSPAEDRGEPDKFANMTAREHFDRQFTPTSQLPDPAVFATNLTRRTVEVISGLRDIIQIARWVNEDVYLSVQAETNSRARKRSLLPPGAQGLMVRDFTVTRVKISEPREGIIEACLMVGSGLRMRAVALRLEGFDRRWRASSFSLI